MADGGIESGAKGGREKLWPQRNARNTKNTSFAVFAFFRGDCSDFVTSVYLAGLQAGSETAKNAKYAKHGKGPGHGRSNIER
jgi:hypothetical protein